MKIDAGAQSILRQMGRTDKSLGNAQAQIASGLKNPNPASDPSASILAKNINMEISTTKRVQSVVTQAKNTAEIAWGTLRANTEILNKMRTLAIQASNGTHMSQDRNDMNAVFQNHVEQISSNACATWGSRTLLDGSFFMNCQTSSNVIEASVTGTDITAELNDDDLTINGVNVGAVGASALEIAAAINAQTSITQVTASILASATGRGEFSNISAADPVIIINGVEVHVGPFAETDSVDKVIGKVTAAINQCPDLLDLSISATNVNGHLQINAYSGDELTIVYSGISENNVAGPASATYSSAVSLLSVNPIIIGGTAPENAGLVSGTIAASGITTVTFSDMRADAIFSSAIPDLTTQSNAQAAISAIDAALTNVLNEMTRISSSYSSRFEDLEENMGEIVLNLQEDLSALEDVDFAEAITNTERLKALKEAAMAALKTEFRAYDQLGHLVADSLRGH